MRNRSLSKRKNKLPANSTDQSRRASLVHAQYSGPLPPPSLLADFEKVLPGSAERIFQYSEREQQHRHEMDRVQVKTGSGIRIANTVIDFIARLFGIAFLFATVVASGYFAFVTPDFRFAALFFSPTVVLALIALIMGKKNKS